MQGFPRAKKHLGQHFLKNIQVAERMGSLVAKTNSLVLEIGPGTGVLTEALLQNSNVSKVIAIEKDVDMFSSLDGLLRDNGDRLELIQGDAQKYDSIVDIMKNKLEQYTNLYVVSNLPYNIGTTILLNIIAGEISFSSIVVMLQKEVVQRLVSKERTKSYGRISVLCQSRYHCKTICNLSPNSFVPPPKVDSSVLELVRKQDEVSDDLFNALDKICTVGFSCRRKTFVNNIDRYLKIERDAELEIARENIPSGIRIEELSVPQLIVLAKKMVNHS